MRLKKDNNRLDQEKLELKVAAEKYQKRAIYTRKKFAELKVSIDTGKVRPASATSKNTTEDASKYRLKCSELTAQLRIMKDSVDTSKGEVELIKSKLDAIGGEKSGFRSENEKLKLTISKMTEKLLKLEKNDKRKKQYAKIQEKISNSIKTDDRDKYSADLANLRDIESSPERPKKHDHSPPKKDSHRSKSSSSSSSSSSDKSGKSKK